MAKAQTVSVVDQVKEALDGRTQRWLALNIKMPETDLSKKMNEKEDFTDEEISAINEALNCKIKK